MAKYFESLVRSDPSFEIPAKRHLGLVVFRLKVLCSCMAPGEGCFYSRVEGVLSLSDQ
jgi:hypothetical protein